MNSRRIWLSSVALFAAGVAAGSAISKEAPRSHARTGSSLGHVKGIRIVPVEDLVGNPGKDGSQSRFVGCQTAFDATVLIGGVDMRVRIDGTNAFELATIHNAPRNV